jgi:TonB family protein
MTAIGSIRGQFASNYDSFLKKGEQKVSSNYLEIISKLRSGMHIVRTFYPERMNMTFFRTYKTADQKILHGPYKHWDDHGNLKVEGNYKEGDKVGIWKSYNSKTGNLSAEQLFKAGLEEGVHKRYYEDGQLARTTTWKAGEKQGPFVIYDKDGSVYSKGIYKNDEIEQQDRIEEDPPAYLKADADGVYTIVGQMPRFPGCEAEAGDHNAKKNCADQKLLKFIYRNIKYPTTAHIMGAEGMVIMTFTVYEDGTIRDVEALRGVCQGMEEECIRVLELMPNWTPGRKDGEVVRVKYNLPIRFKLN